MLLKTTLKAKATVELRLSKKKKRRLQQAGNTELVWRVAVQSKHCIRSDCVAATVSEEDATENKVVVAVCARLRRSLIGEAEVAFATFEATVCATTSCALQRLLRLIVCYCCKGYDRCV